MAARIAPIRHHSVTPRRGPGVGTIGARTTHHHPTPVALMTRTAFPMMDGVPIQKICQFSSNSRNSQPVESRTSKDGVVGWPIDFDVAAKVEGNESQVSKSWKNATVFDLIVGK